MRSPLTCILDAETIILLARERSEKTGIPTTPADFLRDAPDNWYTAFGDPDDDEDTRLVPLNQCTWKDDPND